MKICITGHRPSKLPAQYGYDIHNAAYQLLGLAIQDAIFAEALYHQTLELTCISGMALGVDQLYVALADEIRHNRLFYKVLITAAVPCRGQELKWPVPSREIYHKLLALCDNVQYVTNGSFTPSCMEERNRWMVDHSDAVIAIWNGKPGSTANCIRYAKQQRKTIYYIDPDTYRVAVRRPT